MRPHLQVRARLAISGTGVLISLGLLGLAAPSTAGAAVTLSCPRVPVLLNDYLQKHIRFHYLNDELRGRAIESYIKRLDPSKTLLLRDEAETLRQELASVFLDVNGGDCTALDRIQKDILSRYQEMEAYVESLLSREDYAVDPSVVLIIDPDKRGHPKTVEDRNELYTKFIHFQMSNYLMNDLELDEAKKKLIHRYELMSKRASELDKQDIYASFLDAFANSLDPHSNYLPADVLEDFQIGMGLSLEGIGVALSSRDGYSVVEKIIPGGATDRVKALEPKDKIIAVAQEEGEFVDVIDMDLREVVRLIRGKRGTKVHLTVLRLGKTTQRLGVTIVRDKIDLVESAAKLRFETVDIEGEPVKLAVLELPSFYGDRNPTKRQSSRDVRKLLAEAKEAGAKGLLLDLSRNGGGLLDHAVAISGLFISEGGIVAVKDAFAKTKVIEDPDNDIHFDGPMVVLTSRVSASASEIVAGAMKDYRRAILVGDDHTFGKGTVQSMVSLPPGLGALKVTTALFFRPGGLSTQHQGVPSDIQLPPFFNTDDFGEMHQRYSLSGEQIAPFLSSKANGRPGKKQRWTPVTDELIAELARRSAARVETNEEFSEISRKIDEARKREGVIHVSEILQRDEPDAPGDAMVTPPATATELDDSDKPSPQQREALQILADYVAQTL